MVEITVAKVDEIVRMLSNGKTLPVERIGSISLGAVFEIVCFARGAGRDSDLRKLIARHGVVGEAQRALDGHVPDVEVYSAPSIEVRAAPTSGSALTGPEWTEHRDRFGRALRNLAGFDSRIATKITASYGEMADNVICHAGDTPGAAVAAAVGFRVFSGGFEFAVADLGRGVLASLQTNPAWAQLKTHGAALSAAIENAATSRTEYGSGRGFTDLHVALADLGGCLRFRSGDASLMLDGTAEPRPVIRGPAPPIGGFQLSVRCRK